MVEHKGQLTSGLNCSMMLRSYDFEKEGRQPYKPAVILKMLLLSHLHGLSQQQTERYVNQSICVDTK